MEGCADDPTDLRVTYRGALALPPTARTADGAEVAITGLSGITWLGEDRYACVMDNSHSFVVLRLTIAPDGTPEAASDIDVRRIAERHDYEDVAISPNALDRRIETRRRRHGESVPERCLVVCEEDTPAIRAIAFDTGELLGVVPIPTPLRSPRPNRGLEALAVDPATGEIWTTTEEAVPADGPAASQDVGTVVRLARIVVPGADGAGGSTVEYAYAVDPPHAFARLVSGESLSGVVAMVSLGKGRLLVLERSAGPGLPPFENRIYAVDTTGATDVSGTERGLADTAFPRLEKRLLWQASTGFNVEGLCLGPRAKDGTRSLVAVADNGGLPGPTRILTFRLDDPADGASEATTP
jgi:hypothetical protein